MSLTRDLVRQIRHKPVGDDDRRQASLFVLDTLACALGALKTEPARILGSVTPPRPGDMARRAFYLGGLAHILELDDLHRSSVTHPGAVVVPAAWAAAEALDLGGRAFLDAVLGGYEASTRIGNAVGFTYESAEGNSIYHSGNVKLTRRFRRGISASLNYTYSKSIDNASTLGGGGTTVAQNDQDLHAERGLSSFDRRHVLAANYILTSPFGQNGAFHSSNEFTTKLLQDWTISGSMSAMSGSPFTARVLGNQSNSGGTGSVGSGRADSTGLPVDDGSGYFNPLAFAIPKPGFFGDAGRNTITGPSQLTMNISLSRSFRIGDDRRRLEFRVDTTNFVNSVNITSIGTVLNANNYGLATNAAGMRTVSMSLRFRF